MFTLASIAARSLSLLGPGRGLCNCLLLFTLLLPNGWTSLLPSHPVTRCCRGNKVCCCRKQGHAPSTRPTLVASTCLPGCGQSLAAPASLLFFATPSDGTLPAPATLPAAPFSLLPFLALLLLAFALFQRPPPAPAPAR